MNFSLQPVSSFMPLSNSKEFEGLSMPALQKAFALEPGLASQAAGQAMTGLSNTDLQPLSSVRDLNSLSGPKTHSDAELREVSKNFETIFMQMMLKEMRNSVAKSSLLGNSQATEIFESMHDEQLSKQLASSGGIGIGDLIYRKLQQVTVAHQKTFS
jgi:Rod binding domain-containing protein